MGESQERVINFLPSNIQEYDPSWDYHPGELLRLAVWHNKELPLEAITKIKTAINDILERDGGKFGRWVLTEVEFRDFLAGFAQCLSIPDEIMQDLIEIMKQYKIKKSNKVKNQ